MVDDSCGAVAVTCCGAVAVTCCGAVVERAANKMMSKTSIGFENKFVLEWGTREAQQKAA